MPASSFGLLVIAGIVMIAGRDDMATLPRGTIYAATMIICNGAVGACLVAGGLAQREQTFRVEGSGAAWPPSLQWRC